MRSPKKKEEELFTEERGHSKRVARYAHIIAEGLHMQEVDKKRLYHHEGYDGRRYPEELKGSDTPFEARIIAVAETFDSIMSTNHEDRKGKSGMQVFIEKFYSAIEEIRKNSGVQFDPEIASVFLKNIDIVDEILVGNERL
jgi:HD-GYP domain-containing protein (c-di-GMP phosphodiesterase class II)